MVTAYSVCGSRCSALDVREGEDARVAGNEQSAGELRVEAQQAWAWPEGDCV